MKMMPTFCCLSRCDQLAHLALLGHAERRGRLVHDQDLGLPVDRAADRDRLALAARERAHRLVELAGRQLDLEGLQHLARRLAHAPAIDRRQDAQAPDARFAPQENVGADVQIVGQRQVLIDRLDAERARLARVGELDRPALVKNLALVRRVHARDALDQRRLAGAVVARQRQHLAGLQVERDLLQRLHAAEALRGAAHLEQRSASSAIRPPRASRP